MGKVYRQDKKSVQRVRARDIVPGDIVEVAGKQTNTAARSIILILTNKMKLKSKWYEQCYISSNISNWPCACAYCKTVAGPLTCCLPSNCEIIYALIPGDDGLIGPTGITVVQLGFYLCEILYSTVP